MKKIVFLAFVLVLLTTALVSTRLVITVSSSTTHHVYGGQSIQDAINSAQSGDTIIVHAGTYYEHVTIGKSLSLIGESKHNTIIDGNLTGTVLNVTANNVEITGFTIQRSYQYELWHPTPGSGVYVGKYSTNNNITNNIITHNERGIWLDHSSNNIISKNNVTNNKESISLDKSSNNMISKNSIEKNDGPGIAIGEYSQDNIVTGNNMTNNVSGILLSNDWGNNTISRNNIMNNTLEGISLSHSEYNVFYENNITNNEYGVTQFFESSNNVFYHNNFIDNKYQVEYDAVGMNIWDDGYLSGGNYWSDYTGVDEKSGPHQDKLGSDGIGDTTYNKDRYPLMSTWTPPTVSRIVRVPTDLPTIQEAIDAAGTGYTIFVYKGTYPECLVIRKTLLLVGEEPATTIIDGGGEGNVINIGANNVVVQNFTIRNSGPEYSSAGISIENDGASDMAARASHALISGNTVTNNGWGITFGYTSNNIVMENKITNNSNGIILYSSRNNTISGNNITSNSGNGVQFSESGDNNVFENNIENNSDCGIAFYTTSSDNTITGNNLIKNKYGVYLKQAYDNKFHHNNFISNLNKVYAAPPLYGIVSANIWDNGYPSGGNYWSDYTGTDPDHDGIGDTPYVIDENNQDNYPLISPLGLEEGPQKDVPLSFWMSWWFYAIVAAVIVALVGAVYFLRKRKPPIQTTPPLPTERP